MVANNPKRGGNGAGHRATSPGSPSPTIRLLAVSGSLRAASSNTALLRAAARLAPGHVEVALYEDLAVLPHYNPDLDDFGGDGAPPEVRDFRSRLGTCDGLIVASPEYVHGVPGAMKNAIDWVVSSGELYGKPTALLNASMVARHAYESLTEILTTGDADIVREASVRVGLPTNRIGEADILADPELSGTLRAAVAALARTIEHGRASRECGTPSRRIAGRG